MSTLPQMDQIASLKQILIKAQSKDNNERNANEQQLQQMLNQDNVSLIQMLMMVVNEQISGDTDTQILQESKMARTLASIVFKNALYVNVYGQNETPQHNQSSWFQMDEETQAQIKGALLSSLGGEQNTSCFDKEYMKDICLCISTIATIEIPTGKWDNFVDIMAEQGMQDQQQLFKFAGIYSLGLVMDVLEPTDMKQNDYIKIWETMISNICPQNIELTSIVSQSILRLSSMSHIVFQDPNYKQKIMSSIFDLTKIQNSEIQMNTLQAIVEIAKINYESMDIYLNQIFEMTERFLSVVGKDEEEDDKLARLSIEVWNTLCEIEIERMKFPTVPDLNIMRNYDWQKLATLYCNSLQHTGFDLSNHSLDDDNELSICIACTNGLNFLSQISLDGQFLKTVFNFVSQFIDHHQQSGTKNWITDYICVMAMNSSVDGPSSKLLQENFSGVMNWVYENSIHQHQTVRCVTAHLLQQLATNCPQLFCSGDREIKNFYSFFKENSENQHHRIVIYTMQAMHSLFVSIENDKSNYNINIMNNNFAEIISIGIRNILKMEYIDQGHITAIQDSVNTITQTCDFHSLKQELYQLCDSVINLIQNDILSQNSQYNQEQKEHLINGLGGLLQVIIARLEGNFDQQIANRVIEIVQAIGSQDSMRQGMLLTLNGMINSMSQQDINKITESTLGIIEETIQDAEANQYKFDGSCRRMATGLIQDIITGLCEMSQAYIQRMMILLNIVLKSNELTTDVKIFAIGAIGDLCLHCESSFFQYLPETMDSLVKAGQMSIENPTSNMVIEDRKNINDLRQVLCDAFVSIINGIKSPNNGIQQANPNQELENQNHIRNMFYYVESLLAREDLEINADLAKQVIDLYCDIYMLSGNHELINDPAQQESQREITHMIQNSTVPKNINKHFGPYEMVIRNSEEGSEALDRFTELQQQIAC